MSYIYVLQCEGDRYYVGRTTDIHRRFSDHLRAKKLQVGGSQWTRTHQVLNLQKTILETDDFQELVVTLEYMKKYGIDSVRGAAYTDVNLRHDTVRNIEEIFRSDSFGRTPPASPAVSDPVDECSKKSRPVRQRDAKKLRLEDRNIERM